MCRGYGVIPPFAVYRRHFLDRERRGACKKQSALQDKAIIQAVRIFGFTLNDGGDLF